jgi:hypothetical protein
MSEFVGTTMFGVDAARAGLRGASKTMKREIEDEMKAIGTIVSDEAQSVAASKGLKRSGNLISMIRPMAGTMQVSVRASAKRKSPKYPQGYNYPKVYEYGGRLATMNGKGSNRAIRNVKNRSTTAKRLGLSAGSTHFTGSREFMHPALEAKTPEVVQRMQGVVLKMAIAFKTGTDS